MLMIFEIYTIFLIFAFKSLFERENILLTKYKKRFYYTLTLVLIIIAGFRDSQLVGDYIVYEWMFNDDIRNVEPSFWLITWFVKNVLHGSIQILMLIYAFIAISLKWLAIREYSSYPAISFMVYISDLFILHECTQIRTAVAVSLLLLSLKSLYDKKAKTYFLFVLLATLFHYSSLLMIPLYFLNVQKLNKKNWLLLLCISYIPLVTKLNYITLASQFFGGYIGQKLRSYAGLGKTNFFSVTYLKAFINLCFLLIIFWKIDIIKKLNKYSVLLIKINSFSLFSLGFFSQNVASAARISEFFSVSNILLLPLIVSIIKEKKLARIMIICFCIMILTYRIFINKLILF